MDFWHFFWILIWSFFFVAYLMVLFNIIGDLFRDHAESGWAKAVWIFFLIVVPFLTALIYLIARGNGMAERQMKAVAEAQSAANQYIREVSSSGSAADHIASAKALLSLIHI